MESIEFIEDIPLPTSNILIYKKIYYLEQWLRRILHTSLAAKDGEKWSDSIPSDMMPELRKRQNMLKGRIYLGSENNSNLLWLLTIEEIKRFCLRQEVWPFIKKMTDFNEIEFAENLELLREVRNIIGHNRATTEKTLDLCEVCLKYFSKGVSFFRCSLDLEEMPTTLKAEAEFEERYIQNESFKELEKLIPNHENPENEIQLWENEYFREIVFRVYGSGPPWVDVYEVLNIFKKLESYILAILISVKYQQYRVIWPKSNLIERQQDIIRTFVESTPKIWIQKPYVNQNPRFLGDPKIWFVTENVGGQQYDDIETLRKILFDDNVIPFPKPD